MAEGQKLAVGVFSSHEDTESALNELKASNFSMSKVSVIAKQGDEEKQVAGVEMSDRVGGQDVESPTQVVSNAVSGATWGTILLGLTSLAIPGAGPVLAAGSLGAALLTNLAGTGLGTLETNRLIHALADSGIPEEQARVYSDRLIGGNYLVFLEGSDTEVGQAESVLQNQGVQEWGVYDHQS